MRSRTIRVEQLVQDWWLKEIGDDGLFARIVEAALVEPPTSLVQYARALQIIETHLTALRAGLQARVAELRDGLHKLALREQQIDSIGDLNNEPGTVFPILGEDVSQVPGFDPDGLRRVRLVHQDSRAAAAGAFLDVFGWQNLRSEAAAELRIALEDMEDRERFEAWGLFVDRRSGKGLALGVEVAVREGTQLWSEADLDVQEQARIALELGMEGQGWEAKVEWPASYVGESIGLPLYVAALVCRRALPRHALTASTGRLSIGGNVTAVSGVDEKIHAARSIGIRRVLVPQDNFDEARIAAGSDLTVVPVGHVNEVVRLLRQPVSAVELGYSALIPLVRASLADFGLVLKDEKQEQHGLRLIVANAQSQANIWIYSNGRVRAEGPAGSALEAALQLVGERAPLEPMQRETLSFYLPTDQFQSGLRTALDQLGAVSEKAHDHELWRLILSRGRSRATTILYSSGKCVVQGTAPAWDETRDVASRVTEPIGGLTSGFSKTREQTSSSNTTEEVEPHIGTDEAGKGDYFGPLVSAAVLIDRETHESFRRLGVRDSKLLSDRRVREVAAEIRRIADGRFAVTPINPLRFNELFEQFRREGKNLNSLLAWGHARSIDRLLMKASNNRPEPRFVIVDQFADRHYIEERTKRAGIPVVQRHKAEADLAVAAASVLARDAFLEWLERWSERTQILLPKGASPQVIAAAKNFIRRWGAKSLGEVAKLSFRTTREVLENEDLSDKPRPPWSNDTAEWAIQS